jgi:hypothetical protein
LRAKDRFVDVELGAESAALSGLRVASVIAAAADYHDNQAHGQKT